MVGVIRRGPVTMDVTASAVSFTHTFANRAEYDGFYIAAYRLDKDHWSEGFITV
jgi:hypothetical protein